MVSQTSKQGHSALTNDTTSVKVNGWVDVHCHFTPPISDEEREVRWHAMREAKFMVPKPFVWDLEATLDYMDRAGIAMQLLSNIPKQLDQLKASNDYGASLVNKYPTRFGLLAALPTDNADAALLEIERVSTELNADGFAVTCRYNGVYLSDPSLDPVWAELDKRQAVVFMHPDAYAPASLGRPSPILEVAFETTRCVVDMLYAGVFRRYPKVTFIVAHCGAAVPALSGRLIALGTEEWVPNPNHLTAEEMRKTLARLYVDTAATGSASHLAPALTMTTCDHIVYGSDCGVPCSTETTLNNNIKSLLAFDGLDSSQIEAIGKRALDLFPTAKARLA